MIRELFEDWPEVAWPMTLLVLGLTFFTLDFIMAEPEHHKGIVMDRHYKPERYSSGTGVGMAGGKSVVVSTSSYESEAFLLIVRTPDGEVETTTCSPELYYQKEIGDTLEFVIKKGRFTGSDWSVKGLR